LKFRVSKPEIGFETIFDHPQALDLRQTSTTVLSCIVLLYHQTIPFIRYPMAELMTRILECALAQALAGDMQAACKVFSIALMDGPRLTDAMASTWRYNALVNLLLPDMHRWTLQERVHVNAEPIDFALINAYLYFDEDLEEVIREQREWFSVLETEQEAMQWVQEALAK
jgi:hypothetical protein